MTTSECSVIRNDAVINGRQFSMYSGFLSAVNINQMAEVPKFRSDKPHHQIASTISRPPIDEWQRPLNSEKAESIKMMYSDPDKCNLMANPVLIGFAGTNSGASRVDLLPKMVRLRDGSSQAVEGIFNMIVNYTSGPKPLWILDGQHRVEGMMISAQKDVPIPFVLLYGDTYTPPILAEIFTQVTTKATPMEHLHAEWMNYAFSLDKYRAENRRKAMRTTIHLCMETNLAGAANPFIDRIKFNPYLPSSGYFAFDFDCREWTDLICQNYYDRSGSLNPQDLAEDIVRAVGILEDLDTHRHNDSRLFSTDAHHKILAEGFIIGLLQHLAIHGSKNDDEWREFYSDSTRQFDKSDWSLSFVKTTGALSSANGPVSKEIARDCFLTAFNKPDDLDGVKFSDYLWGVGSHFTISAYVKNSSGKPSRRNCHEERIQCGTTLAPFDVNVGGTNREVIKIRAATPNCHVVSVVDGHHMNPTILLPDAKGKGLDISGSASGRLIIVETMSYSGDTRKATKIRLDK